MVRTAYIVLPVLGVIISVVMFLLYCLLWHRRKVCKEKGKSGRESGSFVEGGNRNIGIVVVGDGSSKNMSTTGSYGGWGWDWTFSTAGDTANGEGGGCDVEGGSDGGDGVGCCGGNSHEFGVGNGGLNGSSGGDCSGASIHETGGGGGGDSGGGGISDHGGGGTSSNDAGGNYDHGGGGGDGGGGFSDYGSGGGSSFW